MEKGIYEYLTKNDLIVGNQAKPCHCQIEDCSENHKLCGLCEQKVIFGAYREMEPTSKYTGDIDHIIPRSRFEELIKYAKKRQITDLNDPKNLQVTHVHCNETKGNKFNPNCRNGYGKMKGPHLD